MSIQIVIARVTDTGLEPTGRTVKRDANWFPEFRSAPEAKAAMWLRKGGHVDIAKAKAFADANGYQVFTYPSSERDPLGKAKQAVLATIASS